jgi:flagellar hook-associated protein 1 FlgK
MRIATNQVNIDGESTHELVWEGTEVTLENSNGQLRGLIDARDEMIPGYIAELDRLARTIVEQVNAIHVTGFGENGSTGVAFFDPDCLEAGNIRLNREITADSSRIAASLSGEAGDQQIAIAIAGLQDVEVMDGNTLTMNDYYNALVGTIGSDSNAASSFAANYELLVQQIDYTRQSIQGVSLDEEMTNMIKYQQAFDAAARVVTTMDQALDTVISGMGIVGR